MRQICLEPNLATILNKTGFTNRQETTVETFGPGVYEVKLLAEFAGYQEYNNLSWYPTGTTSYNPIFSGSEGRLGYIDPPITKTFKATTQFGLSFHSPEARYFTETNRNPDGIKHTQVYKNLDNLNMYLIGFENVLGGGDKDCNDMVISLEITNKPPNKPPTPSGATNVYLNYTYAYYATTTDPEGGYIKYEFHWGDNSKSTTGWKASGTTASATHYWTSEGPYQVRVRAKDTSHLWSEYSNPLTVTVIIIGGGGGCPSLHIYNGTTYNSLGIINIHAQDDITKETFILQEDVYIHNYKACFKLEEGWEGLNYSHSTIDQVKLYAVINGTRHLCPLIHATHSEQGNVLLKLFLSDNWKTDMYLHETIDLKFFVPYQNVEELTFTIEGHNPFKE